MKVRRTAKVKVERFEVGDVIRFKLKDGEKVEAMAVKQDGDNMIFCFVDCLATEYRMNATGTNEGGWDACELREKLNGEILQRFPWKIMSRLVAFENGDLLRIPSEKEIFGKNEYGKEESAEVEQWEPMKLRRNRIAFQGRNGSPEWYWLRDVVSSANFAAVATNGYAYNHNASSANGVRPVFSIKNL